MKFEKILSIKDIKKLEIQEFKKRGNSFSLMKSAGTAAAKVILKLTKKQPIIVVCGPGNNGGDGFIIGNYLHKKNYKVEVFCLKKKACTFCLPILRVHLPNFLPRRALFC